MKKRIREHFGIPDLNYTVYKSGRFQMHSRDVRDYMTDGAMLAIIGNSGTGKSLLFRDARFSLGNPEKDPSAPFFVVVKNEDKEGLRIPAIITAMLLDMLEGTNESIRRDLEARTRQLLYHLGKMCVSGGRLIRRVVVVIENAHRLHANTLMALKGLHENDFAGVWPLFSIVLIGQPVLRDKLDRFKEVRYRFNDVSLDLDREWMGLADREGLLKYVYGNAMTAGARARCAGLFDNPLQMRFELDRRFTEAYAAGQTQLTEDAFELTPRELYEILQQGEKPVSMEKIGEAAGVSKGTVSKFVNGLPVKDADSIKKAMEKKAIERNQQPERSVAVG